MVDTEQLEAEGMATVPDLLAPDIIAEFEQTMRDFALMALKRKGIIPRRADPLTDLLLAGNGFRNRLFPYLKNLRIVQEIAHRATVRLEELGFPGWEGSASPVAFHNLRADVPQEEKYLLKMHQDMSTQCHRAWRVWVPLRDASEDNGTIAVLPGSHREGPITHLIDNPGQIAVPPEILARYEHRVINVPAGSGVILNPLVIHGSVPAKRDSIKFVLLLQLQDLGTLADPDDPDDPLIERIAVVQRRDLSRTL